MGKLTCLSQIYKGSRVEMCVRFSIEEQRARRDRDTFYAKLRGKSFHFKHLLQALKLPTSFFGRKLKHAQNKTGGKKEGDNKKL